MTGFLETKERTYAKAAAWRLLAIVNSYAILTLFSGSSIVLAVMMNISGFFLYVGFERIVNKIAWGRVIDMSK